MFIVDWPILSLFAGDGQRYHPPAGFMRKGLGLSSFTNAGCVHNPNNFRLGGSARAETTDYTDDTDEETNVTKHNPFHISAIRGNFLLFIAVPYA